WFQERGIDHTLVSAAQRDPEPGRELFMAWRAGGIFIMKALFTLTLAILFLGLASTPSHAGWLVFSKPAYKGKIVDADTKEPLEEAVVVAIYHTYPVISGPAGGSSKVINVREAVTDKMGRFEIPSYTTMISPFSTEEYTTFIVFKPGYASVSGIDLENIFSEENVKEVELPWRYNQALKFRFSQGLVGLPKLKTREELLKRVLGFPTGYGSEELPLLYKTYEEEKKMYGF
ncbi:MAG: hypothetical protein RQ760_21570, partial [Sedimentisphaerales bacterium]|nr:hypothetical protein [Sedimentisphaerales bacterium]